jgi:hypothetical protein
MWRVDHYDRQRTPHRRAAPRGGRFTRDYPGANDAHAHEPHGYEPRGYHGGDYRRAYDSDVYRHNNYRHNNYRQNNYDRGGYGEGGFDEAGFDDVAHPPHRPHRPTPPDTDTRWAAPSHRRRREPRGPWSRAWRPDEWWHSIGPEPRADYDWAYEARRPERYGWTGETGRG